MPVDDRFLVMRARAGDTGAYAELLARHQARLLAVCARTLGGDADDVAQDAALVAWLQLGRLRDPARFGPWLAGIGHNLALRARRERLAAQHRLAERAVPEDEAAPAGTDPAERVLAGERRAEIAAAIAALPPGQREAVVLVDLGGVPQTEAAERLGTAAGAVRTRLHKARAALRARLPVPVTRPQERPMPATALPARILDVRRTPAGRHVVILDAAGRELPIWIGAPEAEALAAALRDIEFPRPSAHALALSLVRAAGRTPTGVRVTRLDARTFYAEVVLDDGTAVDARPSDALVLAVTADVPVEVDPAVLEAARTVPDAYAADLAEAPEGGAAMLAGEVRERLARLQREAEAE
jgi:RNA polymerase sigma factor (sigma-70 family)